MFWVYVNYPNPRISLHQEPDCSHIRPRNILHQRVCQIDSATLPDELLKFRNRGYPFKAEASLNDLWIRIDLGDEPSER